MTLANKLTLARIALAPVFVVAFFQDGPAGRGLALATAVAIELTDLLDGYVARRLNQVTDVGKLLDPFADSFSRLTIFFSFAAFDVAPAQAVAPAWALDGPHLIPLWMPLAMLFRDGSLMFLRGLAISSQVVVGARTSGKMKAVVQGAAIIATLASLIAARDLGAHALPVRRIAFGAGLAAVAVTLWSLVDYVAAHRAHLRALG